MRSQLFLSALFCLSCVSSSGGLMDPDDEGKPPVPPIGNKKDELKTGTRLQARYVTGEDGSQAPVSLFDTKLNVDCNFREAEDGKMRCLPTRTATTKPPESIAGYLFTRAMFKDAGCTERLAFSSLCEPVIRYIEYQDTCGGRPRIANAIEVPLPPTIYYRASTGACQGTATAASSVSALYSEVRLYTIGTPRTPEEFVAGTVAAQ